MISIIPWYKVYCFWTQNCLLFVKKRCLCLRGPMTDTNDPSNNSATYAEKFYETQFLFFHQEAIWENSEKCLRIVINHSDECYMKLFFVTTFRVCDAVMLKETSIYMVTRKLCRCNRSYKWKVRLIIGNLLYTRD